MEEIQRKLQILIPQYKENESVLKDLLESIKMQQGINKEEIGVIIVNDGSEVVLDESVLSEYDFDIKYIINKEHLGVSYTRQTALNNSEAEYVMFCDADDMFIDSLAIRKILDYIRDGFDALVFAFYEQVSFEKFKLHSENDCTFVHGKVYNKKFLKENEIEWKTSLIKHEDLYFNCWALAVADNVIRDKTPIYLWKYNKNSVTRNGDFIMDSYADMINSYNCLVDKLLLIGQEKNAAINAYLLICISRKIWKIKTEYNLDDFKEKVWRFRRKRIRLIRSKLSQEERVYWNKCVYEGRI